MGGLWAPSERPVCAAAAAAAAELPARRQPWCAARPQLKPRHRHTAASAPCDTMPAVLT